MTHFFMPMRGNEDAPRFSSSPSDFDTFFDEVEELSLRAGLDVIDTIKWARRYASSESDCWQYVPCLKNNGVPTSFSTFREEVARFYPNLDKRRRYTRRELSKLVEHTTQSANMSQGELGIYYRKFSTISEYLLAHDRLSPRESSSLYFKGLPPALRTRVLQRLEIVKSDVLPDDGYEFEDIHNAALFIIDCGIPIVVQNPPPEPESQEPSQFDTLLDALQTLIASLETQSQQSPPPSLPPPSSFQPHPVHPLPTPGVVIQKPRGGSPHPSTHDPLSALCVCCSAEDHLVYDCPCAEQYLRGEKVASNNNQFSEVFNLHESRSPYPVETHFAEVRNEPISSFNDLLSNEPPRLPPRRLHSSQSYESRSRSPPPHISHLQETPFVSNVVGSSATRAESHLRNPDQVLDPNNVIITREPFTLSCFDDISPSPSLNFEEFESLVSSTVPSPSLPASSSASGHHEDEYDINDILDSYLASDFNDVSQLSDVSPEEFRFSLSPTTSSLPYRVARASPEPCRAVPHDDFDSECESAFSSDASSSSLATLSSTEPPSPPSAASPGTRISIYEPPDDNGIYLPSRVDKVSWTLSASFEQSKPPSASPESFSSLATSPSARSCFNSVMPSNHNDHAVSSALPFLPSSVSFASRLSTSDDPPDPRPTHVPSLESFPESGPPSESLADEDEFGDYAHLSIQSMSPWISPHSTGYNKSLRSPPTVSSSVIDADLSREVMPVDEVDRENQGVRNPPDRNTINTPSFTYQPSFLSPSSVVLQPSEDLNSIFQNPITSTLEVARRPHEKSNVLSSCHSHLLRSSPDVQEVILDPEPAIELANTASLFIDSRLVQPPLPRDLILSKVINATSPSPPDLCRLLVNEEPYFDRSLQSLWRGPELEPVDMLRVSPLYPSALATREPSSFGEFYAIPPGVNMITNETPFLDPRSISEPFYSTQSPPRVIRRQDPARDPYLSSRPTTQPGTGPRPPQCVRASWKSVRVLSETSHRDTNVLELTPTVKHLGVSPNSKLSPSTPSPPRILSSWDPTFASDTSNSLPSPSRVSHTRNPHLIFDIPSSPNSRARASCHSPQCSSCPLEPVNRLGYAKCRTESAAEPPIWTLNQVDQVLNEEIIVVSPEPLAAFAEVSERSEASSSSRATSLYPLEFDRVDLRFTGASLDPSTPPRDHLYESDPTSPFISSSQLLHVILDGRTRTLSSNTLDLSRVNPPFTRRITNPSSSACDDLDRSKLPSLFVVSSQSLHVVLDEKTTIAWPEPLVLSSETSSLRTTASTYALELDEVDPLSLSCCHLDEFEHPCLFAGPSRFPPVVYPAFGSQITRELVPEHGVSAATTGHDISRIPASAVESTTLESSISSLSKSFALLEGPLVTLGPPLACSLDGVAKNASPEVQRLLFDQSHLCSSRPTLVHPPDLPLRDSPLDNPAHVSIEYQPLSRSPSRSKDPPPPSSCLEPLEPPVPLAPSSLLASFVVSPRFLVFHTHLVTH